MDETIGNVPPPNPLQTSAPVQAVVPPPPAPVTPVMPPVSPAPSPAYVAQFTPPPAAIPTPAPTTINETSDQPVKYAGFWIRYVALFVDNLVIGIPLVILSFIVTLGLGAVGVTSLGVKLLAEVIIVLGIWLYFILMTYYKGATLGKMLVGITVKSDDFGKLTLGKVILRETVGKFLSSLILSIGYIMAAFTDRKRALHDMLAHSVVVYKDPKQSHTAGIVIGIIIGLIFGVAVIGILSAIVLASLSTARSMGVSAQTESVITGMRSNAEIYYANNGNSYSSAENCSSGMFASPSFQQFITKLSSLGANPVCYADGTSYALSGTVSSLNTAPAAVPPGSFSPSSPSTSSFCVDSTGYDGEGKATDNGSTDSCGEN